MEQANLMTRISNPKVTVSSGSFSHGSFKGIELCVRISCPVCARRVMFWHVEHTDIGRTDEISRVLKQAVTNLAERFTSHLDVHEGNGPAHSSQEFLVPSAVIDATPNLTVARMEELLIESMCYDVPAKLIDRAKMWLATSKFDNEVKLSMLANLPLAAACDFDARSFTYMSIPPLSYYVNKLHPDRIEDLKKVVFANIGLANGTFTAEELRSVRLRDLQLPPPSEKSPSLSCEPKTFDMLPKYLTHKEVWERIMDLPISEYEKVMDVGSPSLKLTQKQMGDYLGFVVSGERVIRLSTIDRVASMIAAMKTVIRDSETVDSLSNLEFLQDLLAACDTEPALSELLIDAYSNEPNSRTFSEICREIDTLVYNIFKIEFQESGRTSLVHELRKHFSAATAVGILISVTEKRDAEKLEALLAHEDDMSEMADMPVEWILSMA